MAWKLLAITMLLASLTECKPPTQSVTTMSSGPSLGFTLPEQPSTAPKSISSSETVHSLAMTSPLPSALSTPSPSASKQPNSLPRAAASRFTAPPTSKPPPIIPVAAPPSSGLPTGLLCIRGLESTDNYRQPGSPYGDFGGYQYKISTWAGYGGYYRADLAPPAVQDERALADYNQGPAVRHQLWPATSRKCGV